jgi:hypothetical protein
MVYNLEQLDWPTTPLLLSFAGQCGLLLLIKIKRHGKLMPCINCWINGVKGDVNAWLTD